MATLAESFLADLDELSDDEPEAPQAEVRGGGGGEGGERAAGGRRGTRLGGGVAEGRGGRGPVLPLLSAGEGVASRNLS